MSRMMHQNSFPLPGGGGHTSRPEHTLPSPVFQTTPSRLLASRASAAGVTETAVDRNGARFTRDITGIDRTDAPLPLSPVFQSGIPFEDQPLVTTQHGGEGLVFSALAVLACGLGVALVTVSPLIWEWVRG